MKVPRQGTPEWVTWRRSGIGASELGVILGEDPYRSEYELALEKRGEGEPQAENEAMRWGHRIQRLAVEQYSEMTGRKVRNIGTTTVSRRHPHVYASLDGRCVGERRGVEVKLTHAWDEPPRRVVAQCHGQMGVHDLDAVDVMRVGRGYSEPTIHTIERDDALIRDLLELGEDWYVRYVLGPELPPIDGSRGASRRLDRVEGPPEMLADGDQAAMVTRLHQLKVAMKRAEAEHDLVANQLKDSMHGAYTLIGQGFRVSWKPSKPRTTTDWKLVAAAYRTLLLSGVEPPPHIASTDALDAIEQLHTTTGEGARPFRVNVEEGPSK